MEGAGEAVRRGAPMKTIEIADVRARVADGRATILEILPVRYFQEGHLPGARQASLADLAQAAGRLLPDPQAPVILYCSGPTCQNSHWSTSALPRGSCG